MLGLFTQQHSDVSPRTVSVVFDVLLISRRRKLIVFVLLNELLKRNISHVLPAF